MRFKPWMVILGCSIVLAGCAGQTITQIMDDPSFDQEQVWADGCFSNVKQLGTALNIYTTDYDDVLPAPGWDGIAPYVKSSRIMACPRIHVHGEAHFSYAMNEDLVRVPVTSVDDVSGTPLVFEVGSDIPYQLDSFDNILKTPRHKGKVFWAALDSSAHFIGETP